MLDSELNMTCIDEQLALSIDAKPLMLLKKHSIKYLNRVVRANSRCVRITLTNLEDSERAYLDAWTIPNLSEGTRAISWANEKIKISHLN